MNLSFLLEDRKDKFKQPLLRRGGPLFTCQSWRVTFQDIRQIWTAAEQSCFLPRRAVQQITFSDGFGNFFFVHRGNFQLVFSRRPFLFFAVAVFLLLSLFHKTVLKGVTRKSKKSRGPEGRHEKAKRVEAQRGDTKKQKRVEPQKGDVKTPRVEGLLVLSRGVTKTLTFLSLPIDNFPLCTHITHTSSRKSCLISPLPFFSCSLARALFQSQLWNTKERIDDKSYFLPCPA